MKNEGKENKQTSSKHSLQGTQDKENRTGRYVFISNSALNIRTKAWISQWPQYSIIGKQSNSTKYLDQDITKNCSKTKREC